MPHEIARKFNAGSVYLIKERQPSLSYRIFNGLATPQTPSLCVSIFFPETVRQMYSVANSRIVWLAETPGDDYIPPTGLSQLRNTISEFVDTRGQKCVVLLDGLERLISRNGFARALAWIEQLAEFVAQRRVTVLVPFSPETVERKELANLERVLPTLDGRTLANELEAADVSRMLMGDDKGVV